jgi:hypothetical protein
MRTSPDDSEVALRMPNYQTLWTREVTPALKIVLKYFEQPAGTQMPVSKNIMFFLQTTHGDVPIDAPQVEALVAMATR